MSRTETLDNTKMTNGPITRILLSFAGPVLLGQLLQQLYNIADAAIVGQFLSSKALAAVGATSSKCEKLKFFGVKIINCFSL